MQICSFKDWNIKIYEKNYQTLKEIVQHLKTKEKAQNFENIVSIQNM